MFCLTCAMAPAVCSAALHPPVRGKMRYLVVYAIYSIWLQGVVYSHEEAQKYQIGVGIHDMTGPAAQINFMGYARAGQTAHGILQRLYARAFVISTNDNDDEANNERAGAAIPQVKAVSRLQWPLAKSRPVEPTREQHASSLDPSRTICFVSMDAGMGSDLLNIKVLTRLDELRGGADNNPCNIDNLSVSGTHTHSAPAGFLQYTLFQITSLGYSSETMEAYVTGVANALDQALNGMQDGHLFIAQGHVDGANINRSPSSYLLNSVEERDLYKDGDTDQTMLQLNLVRSSDQAALGVLNWYAVHGTSLNSTNQLISGDNKGYASYVMERQLKMNNASFTAAAFAATNLGDVSPNTAGPRCIDTGLPCDFNTSTCHGRTELCIASGPGRDMYESTQIIGQKQADVARQLLHNRTVPLTGPVNVRHAFVDMSNLTVTLANGSNVQSCPAALGYSFAAGTTDGPGDFDFTQGQNSSNPFWNMMSGFLSTPNQQQVDCQAPKPILLNVGRAKLPYRWDANVVPISIMQVGQLYILNVPAEFTTMAGRRLRQVVADQLRAAGMAEPVVTIAGLANSYTHYVTTVEEYAGQRYEAASTLYGPYTLDAYRQEFGRLTQDLLDGANSYSESPPRDASHDQISLIPPVELDTIGWGQSFGSVAVEPVDQYVRGNDTVVVSFRSANPRNNPRLGGTFLTVDYMDDDKGNWHTVWDDHDWCTRYYWKGGAGYFGVSFAEIHWTIPNDTATGLYRICHFGTRKTLLGDVESALYNMPIWLRSNLVGSVVVNVAIETFKLSVALSEKVRHWLSGAGHSRLKDFHGCTRQFLVHDA